MASTTKKGSKNTKQSRAVVKLSPAKRARTVAELRQDLDVSFNELQQRKRQLAEAREQQTATAKALRDALERPDGNG